MTGRNFGSDTMKIIPLKFSAISPIQYLYLAAAGGMRTSDFIGDIALKYSFLRQMGLQGLPEPGKTKPTYKELNSYHFWLTVGVSEYRATGQGEDVQFMKNMIRNTMQGADYNGSNVHPSFKTGQLMYKNFFFVQPLKPGNTFYSYLIFDENEFSVKDIPKCIRIGNNKTGLLKVDRYLGDIRAVINLYTIKNIMGKNPGKIKNDFTLHLLLQYYLNGFYTKEEVMEFYEPD